MAETTKTPTGKKSKSAKGAPRPRKRRGRTTNRRRERSLRKAAKRLTTLRASMDDSMPSSLRSMTFAAMANLTSQIDAMKAAQSRAVARIIRK